MSRRWRLGTVEFSHEAAKAQPQWLADERRISRPVGTICVSCPGPAFENAGYCHGVPVGPSGHRFPEAFPHRGTEGLKKLFFLCFLRIFAAIENV
jgi:hypothetical protein